MKPEPTSSRRGATLAFALVAVLACVSALAAGPAWLTGWETVKGAGAVKKEERVLGHFTGVAVSLPAQVEVRIGNVEGVTVETDENLLALVQTRIENGSLEIRAVRDRLEIKPSVLKIVVRAKEIEELSVGGSGSITADALKGKNLELNVGGSGSIEVKSAESQNVSASMGGSGRVKVGGGATRKLEIAIGGSGDVQAGQLKADDVDVSIGGSGDVTVWAREKLNVSVAGSGDINYWGDPKVRSSIVGSGGAKRLGAAPR
ncbi:MAG: head GIN domain-containing protein [Pseudomonadota bacterium]